MVDIKNRDSQKGSESEKRKKKNFLSQLIEAKRTLFQYVMINTMLFLLVWMSNIRLSTRHFNFVTIII